MPGAALPLDPDRALELRGVRHLPELQPGPLARLGLDSPALRRRGDDDLAIGVGVGPGLGEGEGIAFALEAAADHLVVFVDVDVGRLVRGQGRLRAGPGQADRHAIDELQDLLVRLAAGDHLAQRRRLVEQRHQARLELRADELLRRPHVELRPRPSIEAPADDIKDAVRLRHLGAGDERADLVARVLEEADKRDDVRGQPRVTRPGNAGAERVDAVCPCPLVGARLLPWGQQPHRPRQDQRARLQLASQLLRKRH